MWLGKARNAGFAAVSVLVRRPMTQERLQRYPVYRAGLLDDLFAVLAPEEREHAIQSAVIEGHRRERA